MKTMLNRIAVFSLIGPAAFFAGSAAAQPWVCADTNVGGFCMDMYEATAPNTVENFLNYVDDGDYDNTLIHRSRVFALRLLQTGGYYGDPDLGEMVPEDPPVNNEFDLPNLRGSVAMAKISQDPDSATSQWFVNLANNATSLDFENGGYTVFARIISGLDVLDRINNLQRVGLTGALGPAFEAVPVLRNDGEGIEVDDMVVIHSVYRTSVDPQSLTTLIGGLLTFPVRIDGTLYEATMEVESTGPYVLHVDPASIKALTDTGQDSATFSGETGVLVIPSLRAGRNVFLDVTLRMTDKENLRFTLESFGRRQSGE